MCATRKAEFQTSTSALTTSWGRDVEARRAGRPNRVGEDMAAEAADRRRTLQRGTCCIAAGLGDDADDSASWNYSA